MHIGYHVLYLRKKWLNHVSRRHRKLEPRPASMQVKNTENTHWKHKTILSSIHVKSKLCEGKELQMALTLGVRATVYHLKNVWGKNQRPHHWM
jgi:hypothetical protein